MIRVGTKARIMDNLVHPNLAGSEATVIWRRGKRWVRVRVDTHAQPLGPEGKGWFLPQSAVQPC